MNTEKEYKNYPIRALARIIIETETPLKISSGNNEIFSDSPIMLDVNDLPYIPGTSIAGVVRSKFKDGDIKHVFGHNEDNGLGSRFIFTEGKLVGKNNKVFDGLLTNDERNKIDFLDTPIRQHVRITHRGVGKDNNLFNEQILIKGARFCFQIEMITDEDNKNSDIYLFHHTLNLFQSDNIFIGGGSRRGFGKVKHICIKQRILNLNTEEDCTDYLNNYSSNLSTYCDSFWKPYLEKSDTLSDANKQAVSESSQDCKILYILHLEPHSFFLFGSGKENDCGDLGLTQVKEQIIKWEGGTPKLENRILIPASSIKGAIAHRVAYRYNQINHHFIKERQEGNSSYQTEEKGDCGDKQNDAVFYLFGTGEDTPKNKKQHIRGFATFEDIFINDINNTNSNYTIAHNKIDRLTGGTINSALFFENPYYAKGVKENNGEATKKIDIRITLDCSAMHKRIVKELQNEKDVHTKFDNIIKAFEQTLTDICRGMLPLGGGVNRGNGIFIGEWNKEKI